MAEGLPRTPDQPETPEKPAAKAPESGRFKLFLQELFSEKPAEKAGEKSADKKESEDDDEETSKDKKGRFGRAWQMLFPKVAQKETIEGASVRTGGGLFFERSDVAAETTAAEVSAESTTVTPASTTAEANTTVTEAPVEASSVDVAVETSVPEAPTATLATERPAEHAADTPEPTLTSTERPAERPRTTTFDRIPDEVVYTTSRAEASPAPQPQVIERSAAPERVVASLNTTERMRQSRIERRQKDIEREVKRTNREAKRQEPDVVYTREAVVQQNTIERAPVPRTHTIETIKTVEKPVIKTEVAESETVAQNGPERQPQPEQKRVAEQLLHTEIKEVTEDSKEIAYELSHEHKDMDKQSAGAWAALQASADAQAKINAAAIAAAQVAAQQSAQNEADKLAEARQHIVYKQAITGGFITAVIIIAVIIVMILLQSR